MFSRFTSSIVVAIMLLSAAQPALAVLPDEKLANPILERRAVAISKDLRCVVCQNENIDDSGAPIARDMRLLLRERIAAGDTDQEAIAFLVNRYGNYVLLKPPVQTDTLLLWGAPFAVLVISLALMLRGLRNNRRNRDAEPLNEAETARLAQLLSEGSAGGRLNMNRS